ncbi:MAG: hypothetical protein ACC707_20590 [Thiohalomonadales bacterium]
MIKTITIIAFLSLGAAFNSYADDSDRINQLEKEVQELKLRISKLESLLSNTSEEQVLVNPGEGWKSVINWRKLTTNMSYDEVRNILGEPHRIDGGRIAYWYYQNDGRATFVNNRLQSWQEPRQ